MQSIPSQERNIMNTKAVIVVDLQNEYLSSGKLPLTGIEATLEKAARIIADARKKHIPVIHIRHEFINPDAPFFLPGSDGVQIHSKVAPADNELVILKNYPNSFLKTELEKALDERGIEEVTVIGAMSHMCIDATVRAASDLGYKTTVVHDACATRDVEFDGQLVPAAQVHTAMMSALEFGYAKVINTDQFLAQ